MKLTVRLLICISSLRRYIAITGLILLFTQCNQPRTGEKNILVVHSYEKNYAAYPDFNNQILQEFKKKGIDTKIYTFYLDCESFNETQELERINQMLNSFSSWKPDIILVNDDQATYSLFKCGHPLCKEVPIVFAGVNYPNWELLKNFTNVTGFHDKIDFTENIKMIEDVTGSRALVYAFIDSTYLDLKIREDLSRQLSLENIPIEAATDRDMTEVLNDRQRTMTCRQNTAFRLTPVRKRTIGAAILWDIGKYSNFTYYLQTKRDYVSINIGNLASNISFSAINEAVGYGEGLVGGYFTSLPTQVKEAVGSAVRILGGEKPADIPICQSAKSHILDWNVMQRWHLGKNDVLNKYEIINMPLYEHYCGLFIILSIIILGGVIYLIAYLIYIYRREVFRKRRVMENLKREKESLAKSVQTLKEREHELIATRKLAERAELKQSFLANMSHEIRTPLNAIVGFSNLLASEGELGRDEKQEYIHVINSNCEMLLKLINDILELSRIESGYMSFSYDSTDVKTLMEEIYQTHQMLIPQRLQFIKEFPDIQANIWVDKYRLTQVITNLVNNAAKFTEKGYIKLGYEYQPVDMRINIYIEDSGKGIPADEQKMIFRRFYKQDEFAQGTGLGLSICEVIIEKLGGRITLQSEPGKGSRFTVSFSCGI